LGNSLIFGRDSLGMEYKRTGVLGRMSVRAIDRLLASYQNGTSPFSLSVHFNAPHRKSKI